MFDRHRRWTPCYWAHVQWWIFNHLFLDFVSIICRISSHLLPKFWSGTFNDLDHHQVAALASCFIPVDKSSEQINLRMELAKPLQQLQESARKIAEVLCLSFNVLLTNLFIRKHNWKFLTFSQIQNECKLEVNVDEYVESTVRPFLMDVIYCWSKVSVLYFWC